MTLTQFNGSRFDIVDPFHGDAVHVSIIKERKGSFYVGYRTNWDVLGALRGQPGGPIDYPDQFTFLISLGGSAQYVWLMESQLNSLANRAALTAHLKNYARDVRDDGYVDYYKNTMAQLNRMYTQVDD
jgi:hypothetical protein